ncbi:MAG: hypothetical protein IPK98_00450 [Chloracidobacterium sp.]|nr:hypothetical protein [Chloracidobacterium sp.]
MKIVRWCSLFVVLACPALSFTQKNAAPTAEEVKEKQRKLTAIVDQLATEIPNFRLGANRAYLYAISGRHICKTDPKRAAELMQSSIAELTGAQLQAETERKSNQPNELLTSQTTRPRVLNTIAICDAEYALQSLYKTRPIAVERAISGGALKTTKITNSNGNNLSIAQNETSLELAIMRLAADQNPERAIALLKESLKGIFRLKRLLCYRNYMQRIQTKLCHSLTKWLKLTQKGFLINGQPNAQYISLAIRFLAEFSRTKGPPEKSIKLEPSQMRALAEKLFTAYLDQSNNNGYFQPSTLIQFAEKLSPGYIPRLKAQEKSNLARSGRQPGNPALGALLSSNPTAEKLISEAKNYPLESRRQLYSTAANKLADSGDLNAANALLNENFSDDALTNAQDSLNYYYAHRLMMQGKYPEAERIMGDFPESNRNAALINLAIVVFEKDKVENKSGAILILDKVRMQMPEKPANQNEMSQLMRLISAYAKIDTPQAFRMTEGLGPMMNELTEASVLVRSFQGGYDLQQGEFLIGNGMPFNFYPEMSVLRILADNDLDRTTKLLDGFARADIRVSLKLQLAENIANQR